MGSTEAAGRCPPVVRFRLHRGRAVAGVIVTISLLTLVAASPWFGFVLLPPLIWTAWVWRAGTDLDDDGLRVRALLASRRLAWSQVAALHPDRRGHLVAHLTTGGQLPLTAVTAADLPKLVRPGAGAGAPS